MSPTRSVLCALILATASLAASAKDLIVLCAGAVKPALSALEPAWVERSGHRLLITYAPAGELRRKLAAGERADVLIMPTDSLAALEQDGTARAATHRNLGAVSIGIAVKEGAASPDVSSEEGLKRALLGAKSVTYMDPNIGTSGKHFDEVVLPQLAIRDAVRAKAVLGQGGMVAEKVASGEVEMAVQQLTELLPVAGIRIVGVLPPSLQKATVYAGAVMKAAASPDEAAELLAFLASADGQRVFLAKGFTAP